MFRIKEIIVGLLYLYLPLHVFAQPQVPDFGDIPKAEWDITSFDGDTSLGAIVLFDRGEIEFTGNLDIRLKRHVRIKILSEKGYDWATVTIPYYTKDRVQEVSRPDARSYNRLPNGKVESNKVRRRDFFEEKVSENWEQVKFTFPAVQPGTIVEYEYDKEFHRLADFPDWPFQRDIPTLVSYYKANIPEWFNYAFYYQGVDTLDYKQHQRYPAVKMFYFNQNSARGTQHVRFDLNMDEYEWAMRDIPALEEEPYMSSLKNYESKLFVQLASIKYPNGKYQPVLGSWGQVVKELNDLDEFGRRLRSRKEIRQVTEQVIAEAETDFEKMKLIYDYVTKTIQWNEELGILAEQSPEDVLTVKSGTGVEINLLLTQMLREAGLEAKPVLLSTRDNGRLLTIYPIVAQFNHVICEAKIGEKTHYLDAKSELRPYNLLPVADLNGDALVVDGESYRWAQLNSTAPAQETYQITGIMEDSGDLHGSVSANMTGYPALDLRAAFDERDQEDEEILKGEWFEKHSDMQLDSVNITSKETFEAPLSIEAEFSDMKGYQTSNDEFIYLNPMLMLKESSNPFRLEKRKYPIVFPSNFKQKFVLTIYLPKNVQIEDVPKSKMVRLQGNSGLFKRIIQVSNTANSPMLMMLYQIEFGRHIFKPGEYKALKNFWQDLVSTHSELIVLKKGDSNAE